MNWPAGDVKKMSILANIYEAFASFAAAPKLVPWREKNPEYADIVDKVIKMRSKAEKNGD